MNTILAFDTETTGLPDWKSPSDSDSQPHLVQLGALLYNADTREEIDRLDVIIKPDGWEIPEEVSKIHGITTEHALKVGIPEEEALERLLQMWRKPDTTCTRLAHNKTFDQRIIRIALKRYSDEETMEQWAEKDDFKCTMQMAKPIMKLGKRGRYGYKSPKLEEAYRHFTGKELENAHSAMADTTACVEVYFAMLDADKTEAA